MCKKNLELYLLGAAFFVCSCIDSTYDLANKEVSTDVKFESNQLALPLGTLQAIMLDSLIDTDKFDMLGQLDGVYSINMADTLSPYKFDIPKIKFQIPSQQKKIAISDFTTAEITEVEIKGKQPKVTEFKAPNISLEDLKIPALNTEVTGSAVNESVKALLGKIEKQRTIPFNQTFSIKDQEIDFNLDFTLPKEIKSISTIYLASTEKNAQKEEGALVAFEIVHPEILDELTKTINFNITFPKEFNLSLDPTAEGKYTLVDGGHTIKVSNLVVKPGESKSSAIRFYINKLSDLTCKNQKLTISKKITYNVDYKVTGDLTLKKEHTLADFDYQIHSNFALDLRDAAGETNDISIEFNEVPINFDFKFNNLAYIDEIEYVVFDPQKSKLQFTTNMEGGFAPFKLKDGHYLVLDFPNELVINESLSKYPKTNKTGKKVVEYNSTEQSFYIYDLEVFNTNEGSEYNHWELAVEKCDIYEPVIDGAFSHKIQATVKSPNGIVLAATTLESINEALSNIMNKKAEFEFKTSHLEIKNAVIHTEAIMSELSHMVEFEFANDDLPDMIRRIESIGFDNDVPMTFQMKVNGLEKLNTHITLDLHVKLPRILDIVLDENNKDMRIEGDSLFVKMEINPSDKKPAIIKFYCRGLDFTREQNIENGGLRPLGKDGKGHIHYKSEVGIVGNVVVEGTDFHSSAMSKDITVDIGFEVGDIRVKDFHGLLYIDDLGTIEKSFALNLGESLSFLEDENNTIVLSDPQILIIVDNSISVPIGAELALIGKDVDGIEIPTSIIREKIEITPATYDKQTDVVTPQSTKLLFSANPIEREGYQNIVVENLGKLLKEMPATIDVSMKPIIDTLNTQDINLIQTLSFGGNYAVLIPLQFDDFNFAYSDTITNLQTDMGDMMEMFSNVEVGFSMNIKNSLPLQLNLKATPLNEKGKVIRDIKISEFEIPAGNGQAFSDTIQGKDIKFSIRSESGDISALDMLRFDIQASTKSTVDGVALRGDQGIQLSNIVLKIAGDIETKFGK